MNLNQDISILGEWIDRFKDVGKLEDTNGVTRLAYTKEEDQMHEIFKEIAKEIGAHVSEDAVGNSYASLNQESDEKYILMGSHLDSVPNGGRYDGFVGVIGGLLVLKWAKESGFNTPIKIAAFRCEESSAFGKATIGSGLITGKVKEEELKNLKNNKEEILYDVLKSRGLLNEDYAIKNLGEYLEIHIEQGRVLCDQNIEIGVVTAIAAPIRFKLSIDGRQDHSGATPMTMRKDALSAASEIILSLERLGLEESKYSTVATVGEIYETPNALNVVPGFVELGIDIRGIDSKSINNLVSRFKKDIEEITTRREVGYELRMTSISSPVHLDENVIDGLSKSATNLGVNFIKMASGAGHDAMEFADIAKTGMIFIPCKEGISHNPKEHAKIEDIYKACKIICDYLGEVYK